MEIKIGQKFAWDTDSLNEYIDENREDLHLRIVEEARSVRLMQTYDGIKGKQKIHQLDNTITWQSASSCGFNPGGSSKLTNREIEVAEIKVEKEYCNRDLRRVWAQMRLRPGTSAELEDLPFENILMEDILAQNNEAVDIAIWQSDTDSADAMLDKFDGFIKQIGAAAGVRDMNVDGVTEITDSNAFSVFRKAFKSWPAKFTQKKEFGMFAGYETIQKLIQNMIDLNMFHYKAEGIIGNGSGSDAELMILPFIIIPGTACKVWYVPGLNGTSNFYAGFIGASGQFLVGTDLEKDFTSIESGYDARLQSLWYRISFSLGVGFPFADELGKFELAAS